jgi:preprotein translocase subunit SecD
MLMWTRRQAGVLECSKVFCHVVGQIIALAILALWVTSALADSVTLRVVEASPRFKTMPLIVVRFDDDGRKALAKFTTEHVGEDVEFLAAGRVLLKTTVHEPLSTDVISIVGVFGADEIAEIANRIAAEGRVELNAVGRPRR